jgi:hypothetical protein
VGVEAGLAACRVVQLEIINFKTNRIIQAV